MKRFLAFLLTVFSALLIYAQQPAKKVVFIIADGIPADVIEKSPAPALKKIAATGAYTRAHVGGEKGAYSETPTISAVGYNSLLTGTWVNKHNVWDNDIKDPNYQYGTIFRFFKQQYPGKKAGIFSTWTDNRTKLIGESLPQTGNIKLDYVADGYDLDTVNFPHDKQSSYIHAIDERVADEAAKCIRANAPDLSWVYLEYTDDMGHRFGDSKQQAKAIEYLDGQVSRIWDAIEYRKKNFEEDWLFIITTDHGRDAKTGKDHGGQSDRERTTWIITNAKNVNSYFRKSQPGIVDIMPTISRYLNISIPREQLMEVDGVPLTGSISAAEPKAGYAGDSIRISWKVFEKKGNMKIWLAESNRFKEGGRDQYTLIGEVPVAKGKYAFSVKDHASDFYKVAFETPDNYFMNRWIIVKK